jgi:hypothetical protein
MNMTICNRGRDGECRSSQSISVSEIKFHARLEARRPEMLAWAKSTWQLGDSKPSPAPSIEHSMEDVELAGKADYTDSR